MDGRTVLVTGATGFVGSHVAAALERGGWRVRCGVRPTSDLRWIAALRAESVTVSLLDRAALAAAVRGAAAVVHAAGITRAREPGEYSRVNAGGTEALARAAIGAGARRFVLVSSLAARGPDPDPGSPPGSPSAPPDAPVSPYGRSKKEGEERLLAAAGGRLEAVILRPAGVYGPRDRDFLPLFRLAARGIVPAPAGPGALQPVHVDDVASAAVKAVEGRGGEGPYPIAGREVVGWGDLARILGRALDRRVRLLRLPAPAFGAAGYLAEVLAGLTGRHPALDRRRAEDLTRLRWTCDPTPSESDLGWRPEVSLEHGLARTARWYREAGWL